jgi:hypothetical protein
MINPFLYLLFANFNLKRFKIIYNIYLYLQNNFLMIRLKLMILKEDNNEKV